MPTKNRSRCEYCSQVEPHRKSRIVLKSPPKGKTNGSSTDAGNLPSIAVGHEHQMVMEFEDGDHIMERWTWRKNGKDSEMIYHLSRKK